MSAHTLKYLMCLRTGTQPVDGLKSNDDIQSKKYGFGLSIINYNYFSNRAVMERDRLWGISEFNFQTVSRSLLYKGVRIVIIN